MSEINVSAAAVHLGRLIRSLRRDAGLTGQDLARKIHLSQSAVSKMETGKSGIPEWERVELVLVAVDATNEQVASIRRQYELAQLDPNSYQYLAVSGYDVKQRQFVALEADAKLIRDFQTSVVSGLLQTQPYAFSVFKGLGHDDVASDKAAKDRQVRQVILNDLRKRFAFIILDCALYSVHSSIEHHIQQLEYLLWRLKAPNIDLRILDTRTGVPISLPHPFEIIDRRYVSAEAAISELITTVPLEIKAYERLFVELAECALTPDESYDLIASIYSKFKQETTAHQSDT